MQLRPPRLPERKTQLVHSHAPTNIARAAAPTTAAAEKARLSHAIASAPRLVPAGVASPLCWHRMLLHAASCAVRAASLHAWRADADMHRRGAQPCVPLHPHAGAAVRAARRSCRPVGLVAAACILEQPTTNHRGTGLLGSALHTTSATRP
eukprot:354175-Chlamydomonas_euryale.AAC.5